MKIILAGTPDFAVPALHAVHHSDHQLLSVYTQPDRRSGRGRKIRPGPVKLAAQQAGLTVLQPDSLKNAKSIEELSKQQPDVIVVVAYGQILPQQVLDIPTHGCINIHASLLPRWRGAAPIQRSIISGDAKTGVTIMQMARGLDTGDILYQQHTVIESGDTSASLHERLSVMGAEALMVVLGQIESGQLQAKIQDESQVTYAEKINKSEAEIDWNTPTEEILHKIHAFNPWPVAQTQFDGTVIRIRQAEAGQCSEGRTLAGRVIREDKKQGILIATENGAVWVQNLQMPGKKPVSAADFLNGHSLAGKTFGLHGSQANGSQTQGSQLKHE